MPVKLPHPRRSEPPAAGEPPGRDGWAPAGRVVLVRGNARWLPLADESVDLVVSSPPYFRSRNYGYHGQIGAEPTPREYHWRTGATGGHTYTQLRPPGAKDTNLGRVAAHPGGRIPGSVWRIATSGLRVPERLGVRHFAAFPPEWPRRLILGWSPRQVCRACGQGRAPISRRTRHPDRPARRQHRGGDHLADTHGADGRAGSRHRAHSLIVGYRCACPTPDAPTRPGIVLDSFSGTGTTAVVAAALDRIGIGVELSADYQRLARWRAGDPSQHAHLGRGGVRRSLTGSGWA